MHVLTTAPFPSPQVMPTVACLVFTAVNTRRASLQIASGGTGDAGGVRAFTFSELIEAIIQLACTLLMQQREADAQRGVLVTTPLTSDTVCGAISMLLEVEMLSRVRREDIRGFREALQGCASIVALMEGHAGMLRAVHARYALREGEGAQFDDRGGLGLPLSGFTLMVWEAGLVGRELSRQTAKACFVNALAPGDALAGVAEFVEIVARLAHKLTPMTREDRVGAPPPPAKKFAGHQNTLGTKGGKGGAPVTEAEPEAPPAQPALLARAADGVTMCFVPEAEEKLLAKLEVVLIKLAKVARDPADEEAAAAAAFAAIGPPKGPPGPKGPHGPGPPKGSKPINGGAGKPGKAVRQARV